ncbi:MAG TPA: VIT1/CCC1 transporter family protein [Xanthobacteraceae bacterium]|nr:VIT1/CCC1 transporter family protein [Xanthobacteraceae bacterium]
MRFALEHSHSKKAIHDRLAQGPYSNYLRDWIYGGVDGAVTTFAIVAGVVGANLSASIIFILGFANVLADGFAMAAANYSGTKAERDDYERVLSIERRHIALEPEGEREEVRQIFAAKGFAGKDLERVVDVISADPARWVRTMATEEYGLSPHQRSPLWAAFNTFTAFIVCGCVPLATYLFAGSFLACVLGTGATFFAVGTVKSRWSPAGWLRSGVETFLIGMGAAALAFAVGFGLRALLKFSVA